MHEFMLKAVPTASLQGIIPKLELHHKLALARQQVHPLSRELAASSLTP